MIPLRFLALIPASMALLTATTLAHAETPTASTTSTATATKTPTAIPTPFANATATRDNLLAIGKEVAAGGLDATRADAGFGIYAAWKLAYPQMAISGSAVETNGTNISAYSNLMNSKDVGSESNPHLLAFALKDASGKCAAGMAIGFPLYTKFEAVALPAASNCQAAAVVDTVRASQKPTLPPPPSTAVATTAAAAPQPPSTGNSTDQTGTASPAVLAAIGAVMLAAGAATATRRRR